MEKPDKVVFKPLGSKCDLSKVWLQCQFSVACKIIQQFCEPTMRKRLFLGIWLLVFVVIYY